VRLSESDLVQKDRLSARAAGGRGGPCPPRPVNSGVLRPEVELVRVVVGHLHHVGAHPGFLECREQLLGYVPVGVRLRLPHGHHLQAAGVRAGRPGDQAVEVLGRAGLGCVQPQDLPGEREAVLERDAVYVPDVAAESAVEKLVAGADGSNPAEIVNLQLGDCEAAASTPQGGPATATLGRADQLVQNMPSGDQAVQQPDRQGCRAR